MEWDFRLRKERRSNLTLKERIDLLKAAHDASEDWARRISMPTDFWEIVHSVRQRAKELNWKTRLLASQNQLLFYNGPFGRTFKVNLPRPQETLLYVSTTLDLSGALSTIESDNWMEEPK